MGTCDIPDNDPLNKECVPSVTPTPTTNSSCSTSVLGGPPCPIDTVCSPWDLTQMSSDSCYNSDLIAQMLAISGATVNIYKLLGVHEQGKLVDLTGNGVAISSGDIPNYPAQNAYDKFITEWRSAQFGSDITRSAFLGYDFGEIKLSNGRNRYGVETFVRQDVATIKLKQGCNANNRATKIRVERSGDGVKWFGVTMLDVPDCDGMVTLNFPHTVPSRWWRIRPVIFKGGSTDYWAVQALQFIDYEVTTVTNIQDRIFMENRDRDYATSPISLKGSYTPLEVISNQAKHGMSSLFGGTETYTIELSFAQIIAGLGRPIVIGDIIQLPSETQYSASLRPVLKFLEVINVTWSAGGYTANWIPTLVKIMAQPAIASQETQDIFGKLTETIDSSGLVDIDNGDNSKPYQDYTAVSDTIDAAANDQVPERGEDYADAALIDRDQDWLKTHPKYNVNKIDRNRTIFGIDAMPPNGLPYTEGNDLPDVASAKNGDYHRLTYTQLADNIPPRLYRFSSAKNKWIYMESDARFRMKNSKPLLQEFLDPTSSSLTKPQDMDKAF
jgi:hypothetical protein